MGFFRRFARAFRLSRFRPDPEGEIRDEIRFYLEMRAREFVEKDGLSPGEAEAAARRVFGDLERVEDEVVRIDRQGERKRRRWEMSSSLMQNLRWSLRSWSRSPGLTLVALVTLALGIGATTAIFSLADRVLLRAPPVEAPAELVRVYTHCRDGTPRCSSSWPDYQDYRDRSTTLVDLAAFSSVPINVSGGRGAFLARGTVVSGNYFQVLGLNPIAGRLLQPADNLPQSANAVVVLAHDAWKTYFGADPGVVGETVELNGRAFEIVGVAPPDFRGVDLGDDTGIWLPIHAGPLLGDVGTVSRAEDVAMRRSRWIEGLVGRMTADARVDRVRSEMESVAQRLQEEDPDARGGRWVTVDAGARYALTPGSHDSTAQLVGLLLAVVAATLLLACANLANLLLARAEGRRRELGVRAALGAGRGRIAVQLLHEAVLLALAGGALGLLVAGGLQRLLSTFELPGGIPLGAIGLRLDVRVFAFAAGLSLGTGLLFGLIPALRGGRTDVVSALKGEASDSRERALGTRGLLVAVQMGLCVVLLAGSGLFIRTLRNSLRQDLGFDPRGVALARINLTLLAYEDEQAMTFLEDLLARVGSLPGVRSAAATSLVPLQFGGHRALFAEVEGYEPAPDERIRIEYVFVSDEYFQTLRQPLLEGRPLSTADVTRPPSVIVVNRTMAEKYWPQGNALGGTVKVGGSISTRVVGVTDNVTWRTIDDPEVNFVFLPMDPGAAADFVTIVARANDRTDASDLLPLIRREIVALEPRLSPSSLHTMDDQLQVVLMPQRLGALLLTSLGILALTLAGVGIWGVVSYAVGRRTREMGIRIALGATRGSVLGTVVRAMLLPVGLGLTAGLGASWALATTIEAFMFGIPATDPLTFSVTATVLGGVAALATLVPAQRATRVDPVKALAAE